MDFAYTDHDLTLQKLMGSSSEMEYIAEERNLVPSMIEQINTDLTDDNCDCMNIQLSHPIAYRNKILVRKKSVDYLESSGYNLFRQFESDTTWEFFDRPVAEKSDENGTEEFALVTTLLCALHTYAQPFRASPGILKSLVRYFFKTSSNRLDDTTTGRNSPANNIRMNTRYVESEDRNSGTPIVSTRNNGNTSLMNSSVRSGVSTPAVVSTQNNGNTPPMNSSVRSGAMLYVSEYSAAKIENNYPGTFGTKRKRNSSTLGLHDSSNDENNVEDEVPTARGGHMEHKHIVTTSFLSDNNSLSSDSFEVAIAANIEFRSPGNSRFQSEEYSESTQTPTDDFNSSERQEYHECEQNRNGSSERQESGHFKLSGIIDILQDSEGFLRSIEITTDDQVHGTSEMPLVDLSLVWNRRYCDSNNHLTFKLTHPLHYMREYDRIRQSRLSVFNSLMSRQRNGPLSQRKVLEVVARPHYNVFPPADETDIKRQSVIYDNLMNHEGYLRLSLETSRTIESCSADCILGEDQR